MQAFPVQNFPYICPWTSATKVLFCRIPPKRAQTTPPKPLKVTFVVDFASKLWYNHLRWFFKHGEMAERLMALVLKTSDAERHRGFESLSLRHFFPVEQQKEIGFMEKYPRGRRGSPAKGVGCDKRRPGSNPGFSATICPKSPILSDFSAFIRICIRGFFQPEIKKKSSLLLHCLSQCPAPTRLRSGTAGKHSCCCAVCRSAPRRYAPLVSLLSLTWTQ